MFSRFCKLCYGGIDTSVFNLRGYRVAPYLLQKQKPPEGNVPEKDDRVPLVLCKNPKFNFYKGKTFTKFETIPIASQGWHHSKSTDDHFTILPDYEDNDDPYYSEGEHSFKDFPLHPKLIENLSDNNIHTPTEIQSFGIPKMLEGFHSILSAETGCGKTITYLLPLLNDILKWKKLETDKHRRSNSPYGLIVTPSRELADQIGKEVRKLTKDLDIDFRVVTGGRTKRMTSNPSVRNIDLLIGSFGVISKLTTVKIYKLDYIRHLVLDEAHALFDVTFDDKLAHFLRRIHFKRGPAMDLSVLPDGAQMTLVSATKASEMPEYFNEILDIETFVDVKTENFHRVMVPQKFMRVAAIDKPMTLLKLVKPRALSKQPVIVFSNDSSTCDWVSLFLNEFGIRTIQLNGEMQMVIRKGKFAAFQRGEFMVLSTTNAGARGLDTVHVNNILNYDFPMETADYIHRCGRTGRIGTKGECRVTNLICGRLEIALAQKIERAARRRRALPLFNMVEENAKRSHDKETRKKQPEKQVKRKRKSQAGARKKSDDRMKEDSSM